MKKFLKVLVCFVAMIALLGCGSNKVEDTAKELTSLEKFVQDSKASVEELSNDLFDATLEARNNSLVYVYKYKTVYDSSVLGKMKETLDKTIAAQKETFDNVLKSVQAVDANTVSVIVEYYNGDGALISKTEFK